MASYRWIKTESRWSKKLISLSSPDYYYNNKLIIISIPPPLHSFIPGLKLSFSVNPSHRSLPFLLQDWLLGFPGLFTDTSDEHIHFLLFLFSHFLLVVYSVVDQADLC